MTHFWIVKLSKIIIFFFIYMLNFPPMRMGHFKYQHKIISCLYFQRLLLFTPSEDHDIFLCFKNIFGLFFL